jgi:DNA-directed RNA polymerase specialized sigma24 family protein
VSEIDDAYRRTQEGDQEAFTSWVRLCETPMRKSLRRFARYVDVESVVQEGLLRMWRLAPTKKLEGENASLRFALRLVHNLAVSEARRLGNANQPEFVELTELPAVEVPPDPPADDWLRQVILGCLEKLPNRPRAALTARLRESPDRELASWLGMQLNTFLQNIVRARKLMIDCLKRAGVKLEDYR